jgi:fumarate hydratase class II
MNTRTERDTFGPIEVPADRLWGAQTQRSLQNFDISGERSRASSSARWRRSSAPVAVVNHTLGLLTKPRPRPSWRGRRGAGRPARREFPLVVWQTGSGTQTNMNVNEVLANRASELLGGGRGEAAWCTPTTT